MPIIACLPLNIRQYCPVMLCLFDQQYLDITLVG